MHERLDLKHQMSSHSSGRLQLLLVLLVQLVSNLQLLEAGSNVPFKTSFLSSSDYPMSRRYGALISMPLANPEAQPQPDSALLGATNFDGAESNCGSAGSYFSFKEESSLQQEESRNQDQQTRHETGSTSNQPHQQDLTALQSTENQTSANGSGPSAERVITVTNEAETNSTTSVSSSTTTGQPTEASRNNTESQPSASSLATPEGSSPSAQTTEFPNTSTIVTTMASDSTTSSSMPQPTSSVPQVKQDASTSSQTVPSNTSTAQQTNKAATMVAMLMESSNGTTPAGPTAAPAQVTSARPGPGEASTRKAATSSSLLKTTDRPEPSMSSSSSNRDAVHVGAVEEVERLTKSMEPFASNRSSKSRSPLCTYGDSNCGKYVVATVPVVDRWNKSENNNTRIVNEFIFLPEDSSLNFDDSVYSTKRPSTGTEPVESLMAEHRAIDSDVTGSGDSGDDLELDYVNGPDADQPTSRLPTYSGEVRSTSTPPTTERITSTTPALRRQGDNNFSRQTSSTTPSYTSTTAMSTSTSSSTSTTSQPTTTMTTAALNNSTRTPIRSSQMTSFTFRVTPDPASATSPSSSTAGPIQSSAPTARPNQKLMRIPKLQTQAASSPSTSNISTNIVSFSSTSSPKPTTTTTTKRPQARIVNPTRRTKSLAEAHQHRPFFSEPEADLRRRPSTSAYSPLANGADEEEASILTKYAIPSQLSRISGSQRKPTGDSVPASRRPTVHPSRSTITSETSRTLAELRVESERQSARLAQVPTTPVPAQNQATSPRGVDKQQTSTTESTFLFNSTTAAVNLTQTSKALEADKSRLSGQKLNQSSEQNPVHANSERAENNKTIASNMATRDSSASAVPRAVGGQQQMAAKGQQNARLVQSAPERSRRLSPASLVTSEPAKEVETMFVGNHGEEAIILISSSSGVSHTSTLASGSKQASGLSSPVTFNLAHSVELTTAPTFSSTRPTVQVQPVRATPNVAEASIRSKPPEIRGSSEESDSLASAMLGQDQLAHDSNNKAAKQQETTTRRSNTYGKPASKQKFASAQADKQQLADANSGKWLPNPAEEAGTYGDDSPPSLASNLLPGRPGVDYPIHWQVPKTSFDCRDYEQSGFYADIESDCQAYHSCHKGRGGRHTFLCPNGTLFSQELLTCDWWYNVECSASEIYMSSGGADSSTASNSDRNTNGSDGNARSPNELSVA